MTTHFEKELDYLKEITIEMMELVKIQLEKAKISLFEQDLDLAEEIIRNEQRVNALELNIDKECENIIALFQPVATDLRFIISVYKSISEIERIGDHADGIAKVIRNKEKKFSQEILNAIQIKNMFDISIEMLVDITTAFDDLNTDIARKIFKKDKELDKTYSAAKKALIDLIGKPDMPGEDILILHSILSKLERTGDLLTNVAELIIFHLDAEVIKHRKKRKKGKSSANKTEE